MREKMLFMRAAPFFRCAPSTTGKRWAKIMADAVDFLTVGDGRSGGPRGLRKFHLRLPERALLVARCGRLRTLMRR
jgi:hypothetical protein